MSKALIFLFEDSIAKQRGIDDARQFIKDKLKEKDERWRDQFDWHCDWRNGTLITPGARFSAALEFCRTTNLSGIACFDFQLDGVVVTDEQISTVAGNSVDPGLAKHFREKPGLLLAWALATNPKAKMTVLFSTLNALVRADFERPLQKATINGKLGNLNGSVPQLASEGDLGKQLWAWIEEFIDDDPEPESLDIILVIWQEHFKVAQSKWFVTDDDIKGCPIPHNFNVFVNRYHNAQLRAECEVGQYLRSLLSFGYGRYHKDLIAINDLHLRFAGLPSDVQVGIDNVVEWLTTSERFWYLLQRVFGGGKLWMPKPSKSAAVKKELPSHGAFLLLLLAATGPENWDCADFTFAGDGVPESRRRDGDYPILVDDKGEGEYAVSDVEASRVILRKAFDMFAYLSRKHPEDLYNPPTKRMISFSERSNCGLFSLSVDFSATTRFSANRDRPSIMARTQFAQTRQHEPGECLRLYKSFQEACEPNKQGDRCIFSWVLPGLRPNGWTEFLIGVVSRDN